MIEHLYYLEQVVNVVSPHGARHRGEGKGQEVRDQRGQPRRLEVDKLDLSWSPRDLGLPLVPVLEQNIRPPEVAVAYDAKLKY